jgi:hypothetical protein
MELDIAPFDRGQISWGQVEGEATGRRKRAPTPVITRATKDVRTVAVGNGSTSGGGGR